MVALLLVFLPVAPRDHCKMGDTLGKPVTDKHTTVFATRHMTVAACGMQGWRKKMEDAHAIEFKVGSDSRAAFVAVFDGHNGSAAAKYCSLHLMPNILARPEFEQGQIAEAMTAAYLETDRRLRATEFADEGGSTAVSVLVKGDSLYCANVGDSRAVALYRSGDKADVVPLSSDHRPNVPSEVARIEAAGGTVQFDRVNGVLGLTRAIGDFEFKAAKVGDADVITALPEVVARPLENVHFVLVACDGVWDVMSNQEACAFVARELEATNGDAGIVCEKLLDACLADAPHGHGTDNMTAVLWLPHPSFFAKE